MIVCDRCRAESPDDAVYCTVCGTRLDGRAQPAEAEQNGRKTVPPAKVGPPAPILPPPAPATERVATGRERHQPASAVGRPAGPSAQAPVGPLRLRLNSGMTFELAHQASYLIGRRDDARGIHPEVDLSAFGGVEGGVSRSHARIHVQPGGYAIEDLESANETLLNFFRLLPGQLYPLKDGDQLRFGLLTTLVIIR